MSYRYDISKESRQGIGLELTFPDRLRTMRTLVRRLFGWGV